MPIKLYFDVHVKKAIADQLRNRGVDLIRAQEDRADTLPDPLLLDRATELGRVLFTSDDDLLAEATLRQVEGHHFAGVIYAHQLRVSIGDCVRDLEIIALAGEPEDLMNRTEFLPL